MSLRTSADRSVFSSRAAEMYANLAPSLAVARLAEKLAWDGREPEPDLVTPLQDAMDAALDRGTELELEHLTRTAWLGALLHLVLDELPSISFAHRCTKPARPIIVGLLDDASIVPFGRTYEDGSSLILVPDGAVKFGSGMADCLVFLLIHAVRPAGWLRRVRNHRPSDRDLVETATAAVITGIEEMRAFNEPGTARQFRPPVGLTRHARAALELTQAALRSFLLVRRSYGETKRVPLVLDAADRYRSGKMFDVAMAFMLGHEVAHLLLGHTKPSSDDADSTAARRRETEADAMGLELAERYVVTNHPAEARTAFSHARLSAIVALSMSWFHDAGLMVRGSSRHPSAALRLHNALTDHDTRGTVDLGWVYLLFYGLVIRAGWVGAPLEPQAWRRLARDRRSPLRNQGDGRLGDLPLLDRLLGVTTAEFRDYPSLSPGVRKALDHIDGDDAESALGALGIRPRRLQMLLDESRALSHFGLVQILTSCDAVRGCDPSVPVQRVIANQLARYLTRLLRDADRESDLPPPPT